MTSDQRCYQCSHDTHTGKNDRRVLPCKKLPIYVGSLSGGSCKVFVPRKKG